MYRSLLFASMLVLTAQALFAQDTCRIYSVPNPHGAAMTISRVFIVDTVNFSVLNNPGHAYSSR